MIDIDTLKPLIIERLLPLKPDKIILFGSYAYGVPNAESDIDLFLFKDLNRQEARSFKVQARKSIRDLVTKYKVGFDFIVASEKFVKQRDDYFYKNDILKNGQVIYE